MPPERTAPKTFYLNEQHELSRGEKEGGGRIPEYTGIDWAAKGRKIGRSLEAVKASIRSSKDPLREQHYFVLTTPVSEVKKKSKDKKKAPEGVISEPIRFSKDDSQVFRRLGLDLVDVTDEGQAIVHMRPERLDQLTATSGALSRVGAREQVRWAGIDTFGLIPPELRLDDVWIRTLKPHLSTDAVVEFQPLLGRSEIDILLRSIAGVLKRDRKEVLSGMGSDFSGRHWVRGKITPESLRMIAQTFYSIQTVHSPLLSIAASSGRSAQSKATALGKIRIVQNPQDVLSLPTVAVLDTGVPRDHAALAQYLRGSFVSPDSYGSPVGDHGSFVASRVVFGDPEFGDGPPSTPPGRCRFYDVLVGINTREIDDKSVTRAIEAVVGTARDVRVFNLSFDTAPLEQLDFTKRREHLLLVQDLDNLIFRDDLLVVISAGNSPWGVQPTSAYPMNFDDPQWQLGAWARSFNSLTCGSYVGRLAAGGLVRNLGWPSPFARVGPGLCNSPKPDFSAHGGNATEAMQHSPGLGVWGLTGSALWEDRSGTSFAAPLLAREAALTMQLLQSVCQQGARPYAVMAKAFLALGAIPPDVTGPVVALAKRALGRGQATRLELERPAPESAIFLWQGLLEGPSDVARVQIPIPKAWHDTSQKPSLRIVAFWDAPVNAAASELWSTRKITVHLKANPDSSSLHGSRSGHESYPFIDRFYDLRKIPKDARVDGDIWLLELSYSQIADYYAGLTFTPQQRVAFAARLYDGGDKPLSPQSAIQALPVSLTMTRLSVPPQTIKAAVVIRSMN
jgi:hypothetical protein